MARFLPDISLQPRLRLAWTMLVWRLSRPYRPERHYMRGPGPKCREKALGIQGQR
jgi:hypothetical protein